MLEKGNLGKFEISAIGKCVPEVLSFDGKAEFLSAKRGFNPRFNPRFNS